MPNMKVRTFKRTLTTFSWVAVAALVIAALTITMTVSAQTATVPDEPTGLTVTAKGETLIDLSWTAPADDGGAAISGYQIEKFALGNWSTLVVLFDDDTTYSHTGLPAGATRHYRVSAVNSVGVGSPSNSAGATTAAADLLVSNTGQTGLIEDAVDIGDQDKTHSQGFDTGSNPGGYSLASVGLYVDKADLGSGEAFTVYIYTDDGEGAPDALAYTLTSPGSYADNAVAQFTAPAGATLDANTDYHVVFEGTGNLAVDVTVGATSSNGEDHGSRAGWAIENGRRFQGTKDSAGTNFQISVNGSAVPTPVLSLWDLVPAGLRAGDTFRLLFLSSTKRNGGQFGIGIYNTFVKDRAAAGHAAIREYSSGFRVVGCTASVDARVNTRTIYTTSDKGVPSTGSEAPRSPTTTRTSTTAPGTRRPTTRTSPATMGPTPPRASTIPTPAANTTAPRRSSGISLTLSARAHPASAIPTPPPLATAPSAVPIHSLTSTTGPSTASRRSSRSSTSQSKAACPRTGPCSPEPWTAPRTKTGSP